MSEKKIKGGRRRWLYSCTLKHAILSNHQHTEVAELQREWFSESDHELALGNGEMARERRRGLCIGWRGHRRAPVQGNGDARRSRALGLAGAKSLWGLEERRMQMCATSGQEGRAEVADMPQLPMRQSSLR